MTPKDKIERIKERISKEVEWLDENGHDSMLIGKQIGLERALKIVEEER